MRKTVLVVIGSVLIVAGIAMLALPGPGLLVIAVGLLVLASAGVLWAARLLVRARQRLPDPAPDEEEAGFVDTAVHQIDEKMEQLDAVEQIAEEDRQAREERHREDLVTTHQDELRRRSPLDHLPGGRQPDATEPGPR